MATAYKVLGQSAPAATTATNAYTVPSAKYAVVSTITVANRGTGAATYRISIRPNGDTQANQHYIAYDTTVSANDTIALTLGLTADAADVFTVYASTANLSFGIFGSEIDV
jgi:glucose-6-phosphate dehydrogenase assembly protein OpcA